MTTKRHVQLNGAPVSLGATLMLAVLGLVAPALAVERNGDVMTWEVVVGAPVEEVWEVLTTEEGIESWMVPHASIDLCLGGSIRTSYVGEPHIVDPNTIVHRILSYEPGRMISTRVEKSPADFPHGPIIEKVWNVTTFTALGPNHTHVHLSSMGWGEGEAWADARKFFEKGNARTLEQLQKKFERDAGDEEQRVLDLLRSMTGDWVHEANQPSGDVFRVRNHLEEGPGGHGIVTKGWVGNRAGMFYHGSGHIYQDPHTGTVRFLNISETGDIAQGPITMRGSDTLLWDWNSLTQAGESSHYRVEMTLLAGDSYQMKLIHLAEGGAESEMVDAIFRRVQEVPERFLQMRPGIERAGH